MSRACQYRSGNSLLCIASLDALQQHTTLPSRHTPAAHNSSFSMCGRPRYESHGRLLVMSRRLLAHACCRSTKRSMRLHSEWCSHKWPRYCGRVWRLPCQMLAIVCDSLSWSALSDDDAQYRPMVPGCPSRPGGFSSRTACDPSCRDCRHRPAQDSLG